jgi:hypothetical protein
MSKQVVVNDAWVMGQLAGIKVLERELSAQFKKSKPGASEMLRRRVAQLNSWVSLVDDALSARARLAAG